MQLSEISFRSKALRVLWGLVYSVLFRTTPVFFHAWRRFLLQLFGAKIGWPIYIYPSAMIWAPWNLEMGDHSTLAQHVNCYCVDKVKIGCLTTVSQYTYLCTASHDYTDPNIMEKPQMPLVTAPIILGDRVWITADVFIAPGVTVGNGTVVLARSTVVKDLPEWSVAAGSPAEVKKRRELKTTTEAFC